MRFNQIGVLSAAICVSVLSACESLEKTTTNIKETATEIKGAATEVKGAATQVKEGFDVLSSRFKDIDPLAVGQLFRAYVESNRDNKVLEERLAVLDHKRELYPTAYIDLTKERIYLHVEVVGDVPVTVSAYLVTPKEGGEHARTKILNEDLVKALNKQYDLTEQWNGSGVRTVKVGYRTPGVLGTAPSGDMRVTWSLIKADNKGNQLAQLRSESTQDKTVRSQPTEIDLGELYVRFSEK